MLEWCVMHPCHPEVPHRGPMSEADARKWVGETNYGGFYVAKREVGGWERVDEPGPGFVLFVEVTPDVADVHEYATGIAGEIAVWDGVSRVTLRGYGQTLEEVFEVKGKDAGTQEH